MTLKQILLIVLTIVTAVLVSLSLLNSWQKPQIQSQLELYQSNLVLQASQWQPEKSDPNWVAVRDRLFGKEIVEEVLKQYQKARQSLDTTLEETETQLDTLSVQESTPSQIKQLQKTIEQLESLKTTVDLRLGILQAHMGETDAALSRWSASIEQYKLGQGSLMKAETAKLLVALWRDPAQVMPDAQPQIQAGLDGWFRDRALAQLYQVQNRSDELAILQALQQQKAQGAVVKLVLLNGLSVLGLLFGLGLLVFLAWQRFAKGPESILALDEKAAWSIPWNWEIICQVVVLGFFITFFLGQTVAMGVVLPLTYKLLGLDPVDLGNRLQAVSILASYVLAAVAGLLVMYLSLEPFVPLPKDWFRFQLRGKDLLWGLGGYLTAIPLVIGISLLNQQIWQGQGGSNPILEIALQGRDWVAISCFFITASIAAPIFEELIFRGFLLPTLTGFLPVWGAVVASSLVFAVAHLSLSEVLPLLTLGMVLGVVYTRSRNLLAPMLLHGLWNAGTLLSLFVLGSSSA